MTTEFNLSGKIGLVNNIDVVVGEFNPEFHNKVLRVEYVKEFIKRLKEELTKEYDETPSDEFSDVQIRSIIDTLAGDKLTGIEK